MDVAQRLSAVAPDVVHRHGLTALYLVGSQARGTAHSASDVDVAALVPEPGNADLVGLQAELERLTGRRVDVLALGEHLGLPLLGSLLHDAVLLASSDESARVAFEVHVMSLTLDYELHAAPLRRELLRRTAAGRR